MKRGHRVLTINVGTKGAPSFSPDLDLRPSQVADRDQAISATIEKARRVLTRLYAQGQISGVVSAGGGSGTHLATSVMKVLPLGVPKVMVSTVAAHDMSQVVGTKDITVIHSVGDLLGVNSLTGLILDRAAGAVCGMVAPGWQGATDRRRIGLSMFGFITPAAEAVKERLEAGGYEVIAFHANGIGGLALEELAAEGASTPSWTWPPRVGRHPQGRLLQAHRTGPPGTPARGRHPPSGGARRHGLRGVGVHPRYGSPQYADRKIFYYDFRSAVRLSREETLFLAGQLRDKLNRATSAVKVLVPLGGWSAADGPGAPWTNPP